MDFSHNAWLVAASFAIALMAGFSGLTLTRGASALTVPQRKLMVAIAALVLGGGIWSMHFVAMLGLQLPILYYYDGLITLISALIAILIVGLALLILHFRPRTPFSLTLAGSIVGLGIVAMHYVGMLGMELCRPVFAPLGVGIAVIAALALSNLAIWVAYGTRTKSHILLGTGCFGLSVFTMHFVAMAGTGFVGVPNASIAGPALSNEALAMGVTVAAFVICGLFLLNGVSFIGAAPATVATTAAAPDPAPEPEPEAVSDKPDAPRPVPVPYEKEGRTRFLERGAIAAVRAEGHYTVLYSGADKLFCPWSISEAEGRLGPVQFVRAHRSYLINPAYVTGFRREKDTGICFFEGVESLPKVPVSRSRLGAIRAALGV